MRHTVGVRQSVILTRKLYYAAFCQGAIMSFYSTMRQGVVRLGVVRLGCMRHFTTPPSYFLYFVMLNVVFSYCYAKLHYAECRFAECHPIHCRQAEGVDKSTYFC